jgi:hypothetical protein
MEHVRQAAAYHARRHERASIIAKTLGRRCTISVTTCVAIAAISLLGILIQNQANTPLVVTVSFALIAASAISAAQARYGWPEQASVHTQTSVRCYSIVNRIDDFFKKTQHGTGDKPGDDLCDEAKSIMHDFSDVRLSAPTTDELEFFDRMISTHGIR